LSAASQKAAVIIVSTQLLYQRVVATRLVAVASGFAPHGTLIAANDFDVQYL
jgi:hypothetical protein